MSADVLSLTFAALADPTRRAILARLALGEISVTELAAPFKMSLPAISKHLKVLERCGLIARGREAQWRPCRLEAKPMKEAVHYLEEYRQFWEASFDRLEVYLKELQENKNRSKIMAERKNEESLADRTLKLERVFDAPRTLVFEACSKTEHINRWMCPKGFTIPSSSGEFRVGGKWRSNMQAADGEPYPMEGVYEKIVENELIVTSHSWIGDDGKPEHWTTLTFRFEDAGQGKTRLIMEHANLRSKESRDNHVEGWGMCLDKLGPLLAELQGKA